MSRCTMLAFALMLLDGATAGVSRSQEQCLDVRASAFNSVRAQTDGRPRLTAWGDRLQPGMRVIAVSRDLIDLGLDHRTDVTIDGLPGVYRVLDKMGTRWRRKIDIYMGDDVEAALDWGVRRVTIRWLDDQ